MPLMIRSRAGSAGGRRAPQSEGEGTIDFREGHPNLRMLSESAGPCRTAKTPALGRGSTADVATSPTANTPGGPPLHCSVASMEMKPSASAHPHLPAIFRSKFTNLDVPSPLHRAARYAITTFINDKCLVLFVKRSPRLSSRIKARRDGNASEDKKHLFSTFSLPTRIL